MFVHSVQQNVKTAASLVLMWQFIT